ncbi:MAG TPA: hypothetical protein DCX03_01000 [Bacteroidales bacterium]|nr:hypothetical protein [Bacteroidales bacterium]
MIREVYKLNSKWPNATEQSVFELITWLLFIITGGWWFIISCLSVWTPSYRIYGICEFSYILIMGILGLLILPYMIPISQFVGEDKYKMQNGEPKLNRRVSVLLVYMTTFWFFPFFVMLILLKVIIQTVLKVFLIPCLKKASYAIDRCIRKASYAIDRYINNLP